MIIEHPGFYDMTDAQYRADPCLPLSLTASLCKTLIAKSPAHAFADCIKLGGASSADDEAADPDEAAAKSFGSLVHAVILGKGAEIAVSPHDRFQSKEAKEWKAQHVAAGHIIAKQRQMDRASFIRDSVRAALDQFGLSRAFTGPKGIEQAVAWKEGDFWMRSMMDHWHEESATIFDLKTCSSAHPRAIQSTIQNFGYDIQARFYQRGIAALRPELNGRTKFVFIFVETSEPFVVTPVELNGESEAIAESKLMRAVQMWRECVATNRWPGYTSEVLRIEPPAWALGKEIGA